MERIKIENFGSQFNTRKYCFVCLKPIKTCLAGEKPASLNFLFKHLKLNLSDFPSVIACENCDKTIERFLQLCNRLEKIRLEMGYYLEIILKAILKAEEVNVACDISTARESLLIKCHKEVRRSRPQIKLKRLDSAVLKEYNRKPVQSPLQPVDYFDDWTPNLSLAADLESDSNPNDYEDIVLTPIKYIKSEFNISNSHSEESVNSEISLDVPKPTKKRKSYPKSKLKIKCPKCPKMLSRHYLHKHINSFHLKIRPHQCDMCDKSFPEQHMLYYHKTTYHGPKHSNPLNVKLPCKICGKFFFCVKILQKHLKDVHAERKFKCQTCGKRFKLKNHLEKHVSSIHEKKRYPCEFPGCEMDYGQLMSLIHHYRMKHPGFYKSTRRRSENAGKFTVKKKNGNVVMECDICKMNFNNQKSVAQHLWRVHDTRKIKCKDCNYKFSSIAELRAHRERLHGDKLKEVQDKINIKVEPNLI